MYDWHIYMCIREKESHFLVHCITYDQLRLQSLAHLHGLLNIYPNFNN